MGCYSLLSGSMGKYIKQCGLAIIQDQESVKEPFQFVQQMLDLKKKFDRIITESFRSEKKMQKKLKDAFEEFVNVDSRCASHLASYIDELLKSGLKGASEEESEMQLERVIVIFRCALRPPPCTSHNSVLASYLAIIGP
jgi:cullin 3